MCGLQQPHRQQSALFPAPLIFFTVNGLSILRPKIAGITYSILQLCITVTLCVIAIGRITAVETCSPSGPHFIPIRRAVRPNKGVALPFFLRVNRPEDRSTLLLFTMQLYIRIHLFLYQYWRDQIA
jgi:hypothetical protein